MIKISVNFYLSAPTCPCCRHTPPDYHLGKSSGGWTFSFKGNRVAGAGPLVTTFGEWRAEAERRMALGQTLIDEYGAPVEWQALLDLIERKRGEVDRSVEFDARAWTDRDGHRFREGEFC